MRVAFLIADLRGGGAERVLQLISSQACEEGWQVTIFTLDASPPAYAMHPGVNVCPLLSCKRSSDLLIPLYCILFFLKLRTFRPDLILSWLPRANCASLFLRGIVDCPVWISEHVNTLAHLKSLGFRGWLGKLVISFLYPRADGVIAVSAGVAESLGKLGVSRDKIRVIHNPTELLTEPRPESTPLRIVTIGRLAPQKNHAMLLRACKSVLLAHDAVLQIIGDGPLREELVELARNLGLSARVEFTGWQDRPLEVMQGAALFAFSSSWEGFGNALLEAMACGLPVVSTDCPSGPAEILGQGEFGILIPPDNVEAMSEALERLLASSQLRQEFRVKSLSRAQDYSVKNIWALYQAALTS